MTTGRDPVAAKTVLRDRILSARRARTPAERTADSAAIATVLLEGLAGARTIAAYVPEEFEPGHGRLPAVLTRLGARILLPVVAPRSTELAWAVDSGRVAPGRFGLLEPVGPRLGATAIGTAEVVVVPALAVSRDGVRLGRGGGYYDRALRHARPGVVVVALVFDEELLDELPAQAHDHRVAAVVTPSGGWQQLAG